MQFAKRSQRFDSSSSSNSISYGGYDSSSSTTAHTAHTAHSPTTATDAPQPGFIPREFVVTTPSLPGYKIERVVGLVQGNTVRSKNVLHTYMSNLHQIFGGELRSFTELLNEARSEALERLIEEAQHLGANAVVGLRVSSSNIQAQASEIHTYGTAVVVSLAKEHRPQYYDDGGSESD